MVCGYSSKYCMLSRVSESDFCSVFSLQKMFGDANSSLCSSRKSFSFLMKFLTDIVPHEPAAYLQVSFHVLPYRVVRHFQFSDLIILSRSFSTQVLCLAACKASSKNATTWGN